jgi:hypothetical protein
MLANIKTIKTDQLRYAYATAFSRYWSKYSKLLNTYLTSEYQKYLNTEPFGSWFSNGNSSLDHFKYISGNGYFLDNLICKISLISQIKLVK